MSHDSTTCCWSRGRSARPKGIGGRGVGRFPRIGVWSRLSARFARCSTTIGTLAARPPSRPLAARPPDSRSSTPSRSGSGGSQGLRISGRPSSALASLIARTRSARSVATLTSSSTSSTGPPVRPSSGRSSQSISAMSDGAARVAAGTPADPRALERDQRGVAEPRVGAAREGLGDLRGGGGLDHVVGVAGVGDAQRDAQVGVGLDLRADHAGGALRRQDEVYAERTTTSGHVDQAGDEVGQLGGKRRELVDDDQQPRHRLVVGLRVRPGSPRCPSRRRRPAGARDDGARRRRDSSARVVRWPSRSVTIPTVCGQVVAVLERRTALVVDEHEVELVGPVADRERGDQGLQQLGLAGARRTGDQAVRSVQPDVDAEDAVGRLAEHGLEWCAPCPASPASPSSRRARAARARRAVDSRRAARTTRSSVETSRIGASARASRSSHRPLTRSGRTASMCRCWVISRLSWSSSNDATVRHSSGSWRTVRSRQTK